MSEPTFASVEPPPPPLPSPPDQLVLLPTSQPQAQPSSPPLPDGKEQNHQAEKLRGRPDLLSQGRSRVERRSMDGVRASLVRGSGEPHEPKGSSLKNAGVRFRCRAVTKKPKIRIG
jgi:hypothetical protein